MILTITIDVGVKESGYESEKDLKDNIVDFTRNLLINGAENEEVELTFLNVEFLV